MVITKETNIAELIGAYPQATEVFLQYGLHCAGCMAAAFDTIEQGAQAHGIRPEDIDTLVEDLNLVVNEEADTTDLEKIPKPEDDSDD